MTRWKKSSKRCLDCKEIIFNRREHAIRCKSCSRKRNSYQAKKERRKPYIKQKKLKKGFITIIKN